MFSDPVPFNAHTHNHHYTPTMAQAFNKIGGIFPKGSGKGIAGGVGALIALGAVGYGVNAALFNGNLPPSRSPV